MREPLITIEDTPSPEDIRSLGNGLRQYNVSRAGFEGREITLFLRDDKQEILGGAYGWTALNYLHLHVLWLREDVRGKGLGKRLLLAVEQEAWKRGCRHVELETFSFQSPGFYEKLGYKVFGELDNVAGKHKWYFLTKELSGVSE